VQLTAADIEKAMYGTRFGQIRVDRPIFLTSLPRAGTTLMLERLVELPGLATHCYRDMPFVMAPLMWHELSRGFRKPNAVKQRTRGDGMQVGYDSPEAFEEVLWRGFWPDKFTPQGIQLWSADEDARDFHAFFVSHMQRLMAARGARGGCRYISKNNANIGRLPLLRRLFPDAHIVVPVRHPLAQATSLLEQHTRFLARHRDDRFARRYMDDIGHLEFGELHRPIAFEGMDVVARTYGTETLDYWLAYWVQSFRHILGHRNHVIFTSYEGLCQGGPDALTVLARHLGLSSDEARAASANTFWEPKAYCSKKLEVRDAALLDSAEELHRDLRTLSIF
jgi:hypothetical protein